MAVHLKNADELEKMRVAGRLAAEVLENQLQIRGRHMTGA